MTLGIYTIKDYSEAVYAMGDHKRTLQIEHNEITMKTKLLLTRFGGIFSTLRFDEKLFFKTSKDFTPYWDYKPTGAILADSPYLYTSDKIFSLSTKNKIHLLCHVIDGSLVNALR